MSIADNIVQADKYLRDVLTQLNAMKVLYEGTATFVNDVVANVESARSLLQEEPENEETASIEDIFSILAEEEPSINKPSFAPDEEHYYQERDAMSWAEDPVDDSPYSYGGTAQESELARTLSAIQDALENGALGNARSSTDLATLYSNLTAADVARMSPADRAAYDAWLAAMTAANGSMAAAPSSYMQPALPLTPQQVQQQQQQALYEAQMQAAAAARSAQEVAMEEERKARERELAEQARAAAKAAKIAEEQKKAAAAARQAKITKKQMDIAKAQGNRAAVMPSREEIQAMNAQKPHRSVPESYELDVELNDFDVEYVPFQVREFDIQPDGGNSSMYMECLRKDIGEWDVFSLISESAFDVREFTLYGKLSTDGSDTEISWSGDQGLISASVASPHGIGVLVESKRRKGQSAANISSSVSNKGITDVAFVSGVKEALTYLPAMDVDYVSMDIENDDLFYTLWFMDKNADIEVGWIQEDDIVPEDLAGLIKNVSVTLGVYAVEKEGDMGQWRAPREKKTQAGRYHDNPETYEIVQNKALVLGLMRLNLKAISINEIGEIKGHKYQEPA